MARLPCIKTIPKFVTSLSPINEPPKSGAVESPKQFRWGIGNRVQLAGTEAR